MEESLKIREESRKIKEESGEYFPGKFFRDVMLNYNYKIQGYV